MIILQCTALEKKKYPFLLVIEESIESSLQCGYKGEITEGSYSNIPPCQRHGWCSPWKNWSDILLVHLTFLWQAFTVSLWFCGCSAEWRRTMVLTLTSYQKDKGCIFLCPLMVFHNMLNKVFFFFILELQIEYFWKIYWFKSAMNNMLQTHTPPELSNMHSSLGLVSNQHCQWTIRQWKVW